MLNKFAQLLNDKFLWYQMNVARRSTSLTEFSLWLDVSQPSLSQWMRGTGRAPNLENLVKLSKLGAREVFEAAGYLELYEHMLSEAFADPRLREVATAWFDGTLDEQEREQLLAIARGVDQGNTAALNNQETT